MKWHAFWLDILRLWGNSLFHSWRTLTVGQGASWLVIFANLLLVTWGYEFALIILRSDYGDFYQIVAALFNNLSQQLALLVLLFTLLLGIAQFKALSATARDLAELLVVGLIMAQTITLFLHQLLDFRLLPGSWGNTLWLPCLPWLAFAFGVAIGFRRRLQAQLKVTVAATLLAAFIMLTSPVRLWLAAHPTNEDGQPSSATSESPKDKSKILNETYGTPPNPFVTPAAPRGPMKPVTVRTDVMDYINRTYTDKKHRRAAIQLAKALQLTIDDPSNDGHELMRADDCLFAITGVGEVRDSFDKIEELTMNTKERISAYWKWNHQFHGKAFPFASYPENEVCD